MGLDIGDVRIGVALSDELGLVARGLETVPGPSSKASGNQPGEILPARLGEIVREYGVGEVVVGLPYNMDGSVGDRAERIRKLADAMRAEWDVPVHFWDERLTTVAANRVLLDADVSRAKRRKVIDKMAAVIILQDYLDSRENIFKGA
ncbi:MAG: Holliday junction resolvase RuvX [bacterium]